MTVRLSDRVRAAALCCVAYFFTKQVLLCALNVLLLVSASWLAFWNLLEAANLAATLCVIGAALTYTVVRLVRLYTLDRVTGRPDDIGDPPGYHPPDEDFAKRFPDVPRDISELCRRRRIAEPLLLVQKDYIHGHSSSASMLSRLFGERVLLLNACALHGMPPRELKGVIAHELRHLGARTSALRKIVLLFRELLLRPVAGAIAGVVAVGLYSLVQPPQSGPAAWGLFCSAFFGAAVWIVALLLQDLCQAAASRADEHKTDILACLDTGDHGALIGGLERLRENSLRRSTQLERAMKTLEARQSNRPRGPRTILDYLFGPLLLAICWLFITATVIRIRLTPSHPTIPKRRKLLVRIFGPVADVPPGSCDLPNENA